MDWCTAVRRVGTPASPAVDGCLAYTGSRGRPRPPRRGGSHPGPAGPGPAPRIPPGRAADPTRFRAAGSRERALQISIPPGTLNEVIVKFSLHGACPDRGQWRTNAPVGIEPAPPLPRRPSYPVHHTIASRRILQDAWGQGARPARRDEDQWEPDPVQPSRWTPAAQGQWPPHARRRRGVADQSEPATRRSPGRRRTGRRR